MNLAAKKRLILFLAVISYHFTNPDSAFGETTSLPRNREKVTLTEFLDLVGNRHPEREIEEKNVSRSMEAENRIGLLSDPQLSINRERVPLPKSFQLKKSDDMMEDKPEATLGANWSISATQSFPWPGTFNAEIKAAQETTSMMKANNKLSNAARLFEAKELYLAMVRTAKLLEVQKSNLKEAEGVRDFAHARFKQGVGSHMEFLHTHSDTAVLKANINTAETDLVNLKEHALILAQIPEAQAGSYQFELEWPRDLINADQSKAKDNLVDNADYAQTVIIKSKEADLARQEAQYKRSLPSIMASGMLMQEDSGMRMGGASVGISVPIFSGIKRRSYSSEMTTTASLTEDKLRWHEQKKRLALRQVERRIVQIKVNERSLREEIIPPIKEHLKGAIVEYSQGKGGISTIIDGRRTLLNLEQSQIHALEALALANLSREKILAGFVDSEIDRATPLLESVSEGSMGMNGGAMPASMPDKDTMKKRGDGSDTATGADRIINGTQGMENEESAPSQQGMGM